MSPSPVIPGEPPVELTRPKSHTSQAEVPDDTTQSEANGEDLLPVDGGLAAWRLLLAAFVFEALLWGFPLSFGVFQDYYTQLPQFKDNSYISVVGTIACGCFYLGAPVMVPLAQRFPKYRRRMIAFGWPICILGLLASSFVTTVELLIVTQGVMYGLGFLILCYPILSLLNEFWIERRGMAYGVLCGASGISGVFMPFALEALLNRYGYPTTLRGVSVGLAALTGPLIPLFRSRQPVTSRASATKMDWTIVKKPLFWVYVIASTLQGFGFFFPLLFLPSYAPSIGLSSTQGASLLAIISISQVFGQFSFGYMSDRQIPLELLAILSTSVSAVAVLTLWGLGKSFGPLLVFSLLYGFFGAGYVAIWARMGTAISDEPTTALAMFGIFAFGKGIGNVLAGPISAGLLSDPTDIGEYGVAKYSKVVAFTGACMLSSAAISGLWYGKVRLIDKMP